MSNITVANLTCGTCSNEFPLNANTKPLTITCPFCQSSVAEEMINPIYNAIFSMVEVNVELLKTSNQDNGPLFQLNTFGKNVTLPADLINN